LRFLVVAQPNGWGGTEINSTLMIDALGSRGHQVDLWEIPSSGSRHYSTRWQNRHGALVELKDHDASGLRARPWWTARLTRNAPSVIVLAKGYVHTCFPGLDLAARRLRIPVVVIEHEPALFPTDLARVGPLTFLREWLTPGYRRLQLQQALAASRISVSDITDRALNAFLRWTKQERSVIHPGIRFDDFRPDPEGGRAVRSKLGIPGDGLVFGAIGRFHPKKRFDLAVRLFAQVEFPADAWFLLAGGGEERPALEAVISELKIGDRVKLVDWVDGTERRAHLSALDCFVMVSTLEGLGMTLVEALACGCTCIATACGGPEEVLTHPSLGLLVREGDWSSVVAEMARVALMHRRGTLSQGAEERRALVRREYDSETQNARYADRLEAIGRR